ncbi:MAG: glycoside hydrolase family 3 N-terminal domain-containing protein [Nitrososphaerota archaeon]|nr:glycoside hydrolase family 3 C-terminal domain-containing protein [Candidatus Bathyarchaeota archaeon]MDW8048845.1 glycoside hydrolase family 3 N-terminal domain-containing protein [Nitrososphaerota archaeon]
MRETVEIESKIKILLKEMTLEEKIAQLGSCEASGKSAKRLLDSNRFSEERARELLGKGIGEITRLAGGMGEGVSPRDIAKTANMIQRFLVEKTRLGIPAIIHEECLSGLMAYGATTFPQAIGLASTWDPDLVTEVTTSIRRQMRAVGAHQGLAPVLDVTRDPRWGRNEETFGEDPYLVASIGVAYIKGLQGEDLRDGIIATPKHFAAHGFSEGGRNQAPVHVPPRELREVFLFPFEAAVKEAGALSLMNAYHDIDGVPCASSKMLLTEILRHEWGFKGFVVSDYWAIRMLKTFHHVAKDEEDAAIQALEAGIDVELPHSEYYDEPLLNAVKNGKISEAVIDEAVSRVLRAKFLLGLFDNPYVDEAAASEAFETQEDRDLALRAARKSIVLLKNDGILPLAKNLTKIAVIGPNADSTRNLVGDYSYTGHFSCKSDSVRIVSILEGIKRKVSKETEVCYAKGCDISDLSRDGFKEAVEAARDAEVVVAVLGEKSGLSPTDVTGEGRDQADLNLPGVQEDLVKAIYEVNKRIVVVLVNGRPLAVKWIAEKCAALLEAWFPGEEGGNAVADVLFGDYNPGGKLPVSFPQHVGQIPVNYNRRSTSFGSYVFLSSKPLFPFGHGLSYTKFEYSSLTVEPEKVGPAGKITISCMVKNVGDKRGDEVVQLYIRDEVASVTRPLKELKGFRRITLEPGEIKTVTFRLSVDQLAFYDRDMRLIVEPGVFKVMIGSSSDDIRLEGLFEVVGEAKVTPSTRTFFSEVYIK